RQPGRSSPHPERRPRSLPRPSQPRLPESPRALYCQAHARRLPPALPQPDRRQIRRSLESLDVLSFRVRLQCGGESRLFHLTTTALACYLLIEETDMAHVKITVRKNGPYRVEAPEGTIELVDADGNPYDLTGKPAFSLCRCGGSVNKPFCDGTHTKIGFQAAEAAVRATEENKQPNTQSCHCEAVLR